MDSFKIVTFTSNAKVFDAERSFNKQIISASKFPLIIGVPTGDSSASRKSLMCELFYKTKKEKKINQFGASALDHGNQYETVFAEIIKTQIFPNDQVIHDSTEQVSGTMMIQHLQTKKEFMLSATPDLVMYNKEKKERFICEIKCPYRKFIMKEDVSTLKRNDYNQILKQANYIQVQIQLLVWGLEYAYIFYYVPSEPGSPQTNYTMFKIYRDYGLRNFFLCNLLQAYQEIDACKINDKNIKEFACKKGERENSFLVITESMRKHVK